MYTPCNKKQNRHDSNTEKKDIANNTYIKNAVRPVLFNKLHHEI